jgi:DNA-binding response OmpR family regulator
MVSEKEVLVFIVDDNVQGVTSISHYLENKGFKTAWAYNEEDAVSLFDHFKPDIVLMGITFHHTNGFEIAKKLSDAKIIFITSHPEMIVEAKKTKGCLGVVEKPVDFKELTNMLRGIFKIPKPKFE